MRVYVCVPQISWPSIHPPGACCLLRLQDQEHTLITVCARACVTECAYSVHNASRLAFSHPRKQHGGVSLPVRFPFRSQLCMYRCAEGRVRRCTRMQPVTEVPTPLTCLQLRHHARNEGIHNLTHRLHVHALHTHKHTHHRPLTRTLQLQHHARNEGIDHLVRAPCALLKERVRLSGLRCVSHCQCVYGMCQCVNMCVCAPV